LRRRLLLAAPAILFSVSAVVYTAALQIASLPQPDVELGFKADYRPKDRALVLTEVFTDSPAEHAGMKVGDAIVAIDGRALENERSQPDAWRTHRGGDRVEVTIRRPGAATPVVLTGTFRWRSAFGDATFIVQRFQAFYPVPFVVVGVVVLLLRLDDRNAWLVALLFGSFATIPDFPDGFATASQVLRPSLMAYRAIWLGLLGPLFYTFFAVFPASSPVDRRVPWLKWAAILGGLAIGLPGVGDSSLRLPPPFHQWAGQSFSVGFPKYFVFAFLTLGLVSLASSYAAAARNTEAMRKIRVIFWGTVIGLTPALIASAATNFAGISAGTTVTTFTTGAMYVMPLSFAYAVRQHVLDVPVLLRRSARYMLVQRGFTFLLSLVSIALTLVFAGLIAPRLQGVVPLTASSGVTLGAVFGTALLWSGSLVHRRVSGRIDRAFFRSAYDARVILEALAEESGTATDREALARLLAHHLVSALQPVSLAVYLERPDGSMNVAAGTAPFQPECLVPIVGRSGKRAGLLALGARLSEEPYSGEDRRLLASVAGQAGTALENIALGEEIAQRIESERRVAHEMDIAREVQARLLPDSPPRLETLDGAARCVQARAVGGDGYDFLDLGPGLVGFVLADVSGKGIHAALLMANLQAHLRSQSGTAPLDPVRVLEQVNRLLFRSTATQHYATVFFGVYDDTSRRLRYVNCGHNPPVLLPASGGEPIRLPPTAPAVGLFEEWAAREGEMVIGPGDVLAVFSDGVTEATCDGDVEFGETRLIEELRAAQSERAVDVVEAVLAAVQRFSAGVQSDDLTLLVLRGKDR